MKMRDTLYPRICQVNDSTNVIEIAYDYIDAEMMVTYKGNVKYVHQNIAPSIFAQIVSAESVGKELNAAIKKHNIVAVKIDE